MTEKTPADKDSYLHIFINMEVPAIHVSIRGTHKNAIDYMASVKGRNLKLRHIKVSKTEIKVSNEDGVIVE